MADESGSGSALAPPFAERLTFGRQVNNPTLPCEARQPGVRTLIKNAKSTDLPDLRRIAEGAKMFLGEELDSFMSEITSHLDCVERGEVAVSTLVVVTDGEDEGSSVMGAAYFKPEVMAQGVMNLLFIGVLPDGRKRGFGQALLDRFEEAVTASGARLAIIETASDDMFAPAWALYRKAGYDEEARVRDYYNDGLDKLVFRKRP